jgi:hypothetical protein
MTVISPMSEIQEASERPTPSGVGLFVVLAYAFAWAWSLPLAFAGETVEQGQGWPTHVPALLAPLLAAVVVVGFSAGRSAISLDG